MRALFFYLFAAVATAGAAGVLVYSDHAPRALRCLLPTLLALAGICVLLDATPGAALLVAAAALLMSPAMPLAVRLRTAYPEDWKTKITPGFQVFVGALLAAAFLNFAFRVHDLGGAAGIAVAVAAADAASMAGEVGAGAASPGAPLTPLAPIDAPTIAPPVALPGAPIAPVDPLAPIAPGASIAPAGPIAPPAPGGGAEASRAAGEAAGLPAAELLPALVIPALLVLVGALCVLRLLPERRTR